MHFAARISPQSFPPLRTSAPSLMIRPLILRRCRDYKPMSDPTIINKEEPANEEDPVQ